MYTITENIKNKRKEKGLTQRELADLLGISDKTVSRWESGVQVPDALILPDVARLLGTTVSELYGENESEKERIENIAGKEIPPALPIYSKKRMTVFKIQSVIGTTVMVLTAMLLCNLDILRASLDPYNESVRNIYLCVFGGTFIALVINKTVFSLYYQKNEHYHPIYLKTDITFTVPAAVIFSLVILLILPFLHSVHFSLLYVVASYLICIGMLLLMIGFKQRLRKAGVSVTKAVSIVSLILAGVTILAFVGAALGMKLTFPAREILVTEEGIYTQSVAQQLQQTVSYIRNTDYLHYSYYLFLISSVPLIGSLVMNMIELLLKKEKL